MSLKQKLRLSEESDLGSISKALAVGLVSFTRSHANRFDLETLDQDLGTLNIGPDANSSLRELACLAEYVRGPIWALGPNTSSAGLALSYRRRRPGIPVGVNFCTGIHDRDGRGTHCPS